MDEVRNLIIIGSGPSGYTAALYAARANLKPLVIEGVQSGGALMTTTEVENFPGHRDGIMGPELMDNMRAQAEKFGAEFLTDDVTRVELGDKPTEAGTQGLKTVWVGDKEYFARAVILATGSAWRPIGVPGEQELLGHPSAARPNAAQSPAAPGRRRARPPPGRAHSAPGRGPSATAPPPRTARAAPKPPSLWAGRSDGAPPASGTSTRPRTSSSA